jgi:RHS repeat-associated protein
VAVQERDLNADGDFGDANEVACYHSSTLHSTCSLTDASENVVERYRYDAYGACTVLDPDGSADADGLSDAASPYASTGRRVDHESELMQYRHRYYHLGVGRFISRDPAQYADGYSAYLYSQDRPTHLTDPSGREAEGPATWGMYIPGAVVIHTGPSPAVVENTVAMALQHGATEADIEAIRWNMAVQQETFIFGISVGFSTATAVTGTLGGPAAYIQGLGASLQRECEGRPFRPKKGECCYKNEIYRESETLVCYRETFWRGSGHLHAYLSFGHGRTWAWRPDGFGPDAEPGWPRVCRRVTGCSPCALRRAALLMQHDPEWDVPMEDWSPVGHTCVELVAETMKRAGCDPLETPGLLDLYEWDWALDPANLPRPPWQDFGDPHNAL